MTLGVAVTIGRPPRPEQAAAMVQRWRWVHFSTLRAAAHAIVTMQPHMVVLRSVRRPAHDVIAVRQLVALPVVVVVLVEDVRADEGAVCVRAGAQVYCAERAPNMLALTGAALEGAWGERLPSALRFATQPQPSRAGAFH